MRHIIALILVLAACSLGSGCRLFQYLHPHQMWKLNRQPAFGGDDAYFSIPADPLPASKSSGIPDPQTL